MNLDDSTVTSQGRGFKRTMLARSLSPLNKEHYDALGTVFAASNQMLNVGWGKRPIRGFG